MASRNDIAARAAIGFALVVGITAGSIVSSSWLARRTADEREGVLLRYAEDLTHAWQVQAAADRMVASGRGYLLTNDGEMLLRVKESEAQLDSALAALERADVPPAERDRVAAVERAVSSYRRQFADLVETTPSTEDRLTLAAALRERLLPARAALDQGVETLVAHERAVQQEARRGAAAMAAGATRATIALGVGALALSSILAWIFTRRLGEIQRRERLSAKKAARALATKEELLRIVAHDLRSPLAAISLRAQAIDRSADDERLRGAARSIRSTCERMADLIGSLVQAANVESGRLSLCVRTVELEEISRAIVETFGPAAAQKSIRLDSKVTPPALQITVDRERLLQVLSNLVGNALKFTPTGGVVTVRASGLGTVVRFEVRDTGPGIPSADRGRVFERYWRGSDQRAGGLGLGLYIARGIVEAHGGRIWVEDPPEQGTSFFFELPLTSPWVVAADGSPAPGEISNGARAGV